MKKFTLLLLTVLVSLFAQAQTVLTPPEEAVAVAEDWTLSATEDGKANTYSVKVAILNSDIYIKGLALEDSWVKGTVSGNKVTIPTHQYVGTMYSIDFYVEGFGDDGYTDIVFDYDTEKNVLFTSLYIVLASADGQNVYGQMENVVISKNEGAASESWVIDYTMHYQSNSGETKTESGTEPIDVTINGNEVTFNFPNPLNGAAVIEGTLDGNVVTFPKNQQMGTYSGTPFYLGGQDANGLCDVVFNYDSENQVFTLGDMYLIINSSTTTSNPWCYFSKAIIKKSSAQQEDKEITLPEGLTPQRYSFEATEIIYESDGKTIKEMKKVARPVNVAFSETEVYVQGLYNDLPDAWVKGDIDDDQVIFAKGQYLGKVNNIYSIYLLGKSYGELSNITFTLKNKELLQGGYVIFSLYKDQEAPFNVYAGTNIKLFVEKAAIPATPELRYLGYMPDDGYAPLLYQLPLTSEDGKTSLAEEKLSFRIYTEKGGEQTLYTFTKDKYVNLPEASMTEIPYTFTDEYDFQKGLVFLNDNLEDNDRIGIQSVYEGGNETNVSAIAWYQFESTGIAPVKSAGVAREELYDLQGRRVGPQYKGLIIKKAVQPDGSVKTVKMIK